MAAFLLAPLLLFGAPAQAAFVQSGTILGGLTFGTGWTQTGTHVFQDGNNESSSQTRENLHRFWTAIGTTNGGTSPPTASNPIQNFYFRFDTFGTSATQWSKWNIQLNLGNAPQGYADYLLQVEPQGLTSSPPVYVRLNQYTTPVQVGAFTTGSLEARATNEPGHANLTSGASTRLGLWSLTEYGIEIAIPATWFTAPVAPTSAIKADGSGTVYMYGGVFSSTGVLGAVGTTKDALTDATGGTRTLTTNVITGTSSTSSILATQLGYATQPGNANVGASIPSFIVQVRDSSGNRVADATNEITVAIASGTGTLSGTKTVTSVAGNATFSDLSIDTAGTFTLNATSPGLSRSISSSFVISAVVSPSLSVTQSGGSTSVTEAGGTDTFTVALGSAPAGNVVLAVTSNDTTESTVGPSFLHFSSANWSATQTVTVTGVNDAMDDNDQTSTITVSVVDAQSSDEYDAVADTTFSATTTDDDTAGFTVTQSGGTTVVAESGTTDTFTVVLTSQPMTGDVVLAVTSGDTGEATASPSHLHYGGSNWSTAQTVTITGVDDILIDGDQSTTVTISVLDGASSNEYDPLADATVTVTTQDNEVAGFTVTQSGGSTAVAESGTTDTFTVALNTLPLGNVVIAVSSNDTGEAIVSPSHLHFSTLNYSTPQTVAVTGVNDAMDDNDQTSTITLSIVDADSSNEYDNVADQTVSVTTSDDDTAGITVAETSGSTTVSESGTTDTFTVVLDSQPMSGDVVLDVSSADAGEATVSPSSLTFGSSNWSTPRTVTVTSVDDAVVDGNQTTTVTITVRDAASSNEYDGVADRSVAVTTADDDVAGFTVTQSGGTTTVSETGTTDSFTVVLAVQPQGNVVLSVTSNDTGEATASPSRLHFGTGNWSTPQTVTVTGVNDATDDGDQASTITVAVVDAESSNEYDAVPDQTVTATTADDDTAGFTIAESGGSTTVAEAGTTDTFTLVLTSQPLSGTTVVAVSSADAGEATAAPSHLHFGSANWSSPQTVTLTGVNDDVDDGDQSTSITASIVDAQSSDEYDGVGDQTVSATTTDDDTAGITIAQTDGSTSVSETGTTDTFTVVLTSQPASGDVVVSLASNDTGEATVAPSHLHFGSSNWSTPQTVTVTGVDDAASDNDQTSTITVAVVAASSSNEYDALASQTVAVTTLDDDTAGITLVASGGTSTVAESGTTDTFTAVLDTQPTGNVVLAITGNDTGEATVAPSHLHFGPGNWSTPQTVTITGVDDAVDDNDQTSTITVAIVDADSSNEYDAVADATLNVTTTDDDTAGFTVAQSGGSTSVSETGSTDTFTVVLTSQPAAGTVVVSIASNDTGEATVSPATLTFGTGNWSTPQTVTVTGVDDDLDDNDQTSTITLSIADAASSDEYDNVADQTISAATTDDDAAGITVTASGGSTSVNESGTTDTFTVVLDTQPTGSVVLAITSNDTGEATAAPSHLHFGPANWSTPQTVTATGVDDSFDDNDQSSTMTIGVVAADSSADYDAVSAGSLTITTTDDDTAGFTIAQSGGTTSVDESATTDTFTVVLTSQPMSGDVVLSVASNDTGETSVAPSHLHFGAGNWSTPQTVTVTGVDDAIGDGDQNSTITVAVADAASSNEYDAVADQTFVATTTDNDAPGITIAQSGGSTTVAESGTTDTFTVVLDAQPMGTVVLSITSNDTGEAAAAPATLTFGPGNWSTPQTVTITGVNDDRDDNDQTSTITVAILPNATTDEYDGVAAQTVQATTTDDDTAGLTISQSGGSTTVAESGTTDTFTVVLDAQPAGDVVVGVSSNDTGEATASPATLTFGTGNWSTPQTITITGVDDAVDDGDQDSTITLSVADGASSDEYDAVADATLTATTTDDDTAGITVSQSGGTTTVAESGTTDTFTVVLDSQPLGDVVLTITSNDTGEATAAPSHLHFGPGNWSTPQTVTVTGVDDSLDDGDQPATITVAVLDAASSNDYDAVADRTVTSTTTDDDAAGITITQTGGATTVTEAGSNDTFTVVLDAQPAGDVLIVLSSNDTGEATVAPASLTFGPSNWSTPQTVTITGVNDELDDNDQTSTITLSILDAATSADYDGVADATLSVTTTDDDTAGITLDASDGDTTVSEAGTNDTFTVVLDSQPAGDVLLSVASNDTGEATVSPATLTFGPANWSTPQTVRVTGVDDLGVDGDQPVTITVSVVDAASSDDYDAVADRTLAATVVDNDTPGITIAQSGGSTRVNETGTTDTFTVVLDSQPAADVVLSIASNDTGEATVSPGTLTFGPGNWSTPQTITVTGVDDDVDDGNQTSTITVAVLDAASSAEYDALSDETITVTTMDDDAAGIVLTPTGGSTTVSESGTTDTFTVALAAQPSGTVVLNITSNDTGEATVAPATLTFGPANWSTPQTITVSGVDDSLDDGDQASTIAIAIDDAASAGEYAAVPSATLTATTTDDDAAGITVTQSGGSTTVTEAGATDTFTVVLDAQPLGTVVLSITSNDTGEATASPATLTFGPGNWSTPQTITITGVDDTLVDGNQSSTITIAVVDASSSDDYDSVADATLAAATTDDDTTGITVAQTGGSTTVAENGTTDTFTVVLDAQPAADVLITISTNDTGEATAAPATLTFGPGNWSTPQTVTITGVNDDVDDGDQGSTVTLAIVDAASSDEFDALPDATITVTTLDDDTAAIVLAASGGSTNVSESGSNDTFTVVLAAQPTANVTLTVASNDTGETTVAPATLTFGPANWSTPQTITVTGVDDDLADGTQPSTITVAVDDAASAPEYGPVADQTLAATTADNDSATFTVTPSGGSTTVTEAGGNDTVTVVLDSKPSGTVIIVITSNDTGEAIASPATLTFGPGNWSSPQTITITGVDDDLDDGDQASTITIAVDDAASSTEFAGASDATVTVTTTDDDTAGFSVVQSGGSTVVDENGTTDTFTVVLDAQPAGTVVLSIASNDTGEATVSPATLTFGPGNWSTPQTVTVTGADDDLADGTQTSTITMAVVAAASSDDYDGVGAVTLTATTADDDTAGWTLTASGGHTTVNESGSTDTFTVVLDTQPAGPVVLSITSNDTTETTVSPATLTFGPGNWSTPQTVTITGVNDDVDDGDQNSTITVAVVAAASSDEFDSVAASTLTAITVDDDEAGLSITQTGGSTTVSEAGTTENVTVALTAQPAGDVVVAVASNDTGEATAAPATLTFGPTNWSTAQTVTITGVDDMIADGTVQSTITFSIVDAQASDEYDAVADQTITVATTDNDQPGITVAQSGGTTTVNETGTTDTFTVVLDSQPAGEVVVSLSSNDTGEATVSPATLTFGPSNWSTPQTATVTGVDDDVDDGTATFTVTVHVDDPRSSADYDDVADATFSGTTTDDDAAGFIVTQTGGSTVVDENGTTDTFTVVLTSQPRGLVVITVTSNDTGEATASPVVLIFGPDNWSTPKTVTVTGVADTAADGPQTVGITLSISDGASSDEYDAIPDQVVTVTSNDDDTAGITIATTGGSTTVAENGTTDTFTVVLDAQPLGTVVLSVSSNDTGEATASPATLTFGPANWSTPQNVTITGVDDDLDDGNQTTTITVRVVDAASSDDYDAVADATTNVTTIDDDAAGVSIAHTDGSTVVSESGTTDIVTVVLTAQPTVTVVVNLTSNDTGEATVGPVTLTFGPANWSIPQNATITGVDDASVDGNQSVAITAAVDAGRSGADYAAVAAATIAATTTDDDTPGIVITETGGGTRVKETLTTDNITVALTVAPAGTVVLNVTVNDTTEATVRPATLTFGPSNWSTPQTVRIAGADDLFVDGNQTFRITVAVDPSRTSDEYDAASGATVTGTNDDDDVTGQVLQFDAWSDPVPANGSATVPIPQDDPRLLINLTQMQMVVVSATNTSVRTTADILEELPDGTSRPSNVTNVGQIWELGFVDEAGDDVPMTRAEVTFFVSYAWQNVTCAASNCAVRVFHWTGGAWDVIVPEVVTRNATGTMYRIHVASFSPFIVGTVNVGPTDNGGGAAKIRVPTSGGLPDAPPPIVVPPTVPLQGPDPWIGPRLVVVAGTITPYWMWLVLGAMVLGSGVAATLHYDVGPRTLRTGQEAASLLRLGGRRSVQATARLARTGWARLADAALATGQHAKDLLRAAPPELSARPERPVPELLMETRKIQPLFREAREARLRRRTVDPALQARLRREATQLNQLFQALRQERTRRGLAAAFQALPRPHELAHTAATESRRAATAEALRLNEVLRRLAALHRCAMSDDPDERDAALLEMARLNRVLADMRRALRQQGAQVALHGDERPRALDAEPDVDTPPILAVAAAPVAQIRQQVTHGAFRANRAIGALARAQRAPLGPDAATRHQALQEARRFTVMLETLRHVRAASGPPVPGTDRGPGGKKGRRTPRTARNPSPQGTPGRVPTATSRTGSASSTARQASARPTVKDASRKASGSLTKPGPTARRPARSTLRKPNQPRPAKDTKATGKRPDRTRPQGGHRR